VKSMTLLCALAICRLRRRRPHLTALGMALVIVAASGCQATLPGGLSWNEEAKIAKRAQSDSFPSPADVGLTAPTSVP
jgi:hypothetical protein